MESRFISKASDTLRYPPRSLATLMEELTLEKAATMFAEAVKPAVVRQKRKYVKKPKAADGAPPPKKAKRGPRGKRAGVQKPAAAAAVAIPIAREKLAKEKDWRPARSPLVSVDHFPDAGEVMSLEGLPVDLDLACSSCKQKLPAARPKIRAIQFSKRKSRNDPSKGLYEVRRYTLSCECSACLRATTRWLHKHVVDGIRDLVCARAGGSPQ